MSDMILVNKKNKFVVVYVLSVFFVLFGAVNCILTAQESHRNDSRIVAAQIHRLAGESLEEVSLELDRLKAAGFNALIFRVFQNHGDRFHVIAGKQKGNSAAGVYFRTDRAHVVMDLLEPLSQMCREKGIRIFAWMTTRSMDWLNQPEWLGRRFDLEKQKLVVNDRFDLFDSRFEEYLVSLFGDLSSYDIDGIVLQDDFVFRTLEGFSDSAFVEFKVRYGLDLRPEKLFQGIIRGDDGQLYSTRNGELYNAWVKFKSDYLFELGERLVSRCKTSNVNLELCVNVYYDTVLYPDKGKEWLGQDLERIVYSSFDRVLAMVYHRQMVNELDLSVMETIVSLTDMNAKLYLMFGKRLVLKYQIVDWKTGEEISDKELALLGSTAPKGVENIAIVPVEEKSRIYERLHNFISNVFNDANEMATK